MRTHTWAGWIVVGAIGAAGCTGHGTGGTGGEPTGPITSSSSSSTSSSRTATPRSCPPPEPTNHRASAGACPANEGACTTDADCGASDGVCNCAGQQYSIGIYGEDTSPSNTCFSGNCRVDADCGAGYFCSPSYGAGCPRVLQGFYCHTCQDYCIDDSDCGPSVGEGVYLCTFESGNGGWVCQLGGCSGT